MKIRPTRRSRSDLRVTLAIPTPRELKKILIGVIRLRLSKEELHDFPTVSWMGSPSTLPPVERLLLTTKLCQSVVLATIAHNAAYVSYVSQRSMCCSIFQTALSR